MFCCVHTHKVTLFMPFNCRLGTVNALQFFEGTTRADRSHKCTAFMTSAYVNMAMQMFGNTSQTSLITFH